MEICHAELLLMTVRERETLSDPGHALNHCFQGIMGWKLVPSTDTFTRCVFKTLIVACDLHITCFCKTVIISICILELGPSICLIGHSEIGL